MNKKKGEVGKKSDRKNKKKAKKNKKICSFFAVPHS